MESNILMPQLRFPQFTEKWSDEFMGSLYPQIRNGFVGTATPYYRESGVKYLQGKNIKSGEINSKGLVYICDEFHQKSAKSQLRINDILMVQSGHVGECAVVCKEYENANCHALVVCTPVKKIDSRFYVYLFYSRYGLKQIYKIKTGNTIQHILASDLKKVVVPKVEFEEQQKIADFLSAVDKKISLLKQKHSLLQQYKKGVMQQLFSQQIRFKDDNGKTFPDWQEKAMFDVLDQVTREVPKPDEKYLSLGIRSHMKGTFQKPDFDPSSNVMDKLYVVKENDLIVNITFAWEGAIAIAKTKDEGGLVSHRFPTYVFKLDQATHEYFKHIIQEKRFKYMLDLISPGGAGRNRVLSKKEFLKLKWDLPGIDEQKKIAKFLGALDKKINLAAKQIELTKTFKKGLLQQMFV